MTNAGRDENDVPTLLTVESATGTSIVAIQAGPTTHGLKVSDASTGSDQGPVNAMRDENDVPTLLALSSADGTTLVPVYGHAGMILIDTN